MSSFAVEPRRPRSARALIAHLARCDARLVLRDPLLGLLLGLGPALALLARYALPAIDGALAEAGLVPGAPGEAPFSATYPMWVGFLGMWQAALLPGTVFGFLLLEEKETGTLAATRVSPLPRRLHLLWRVAVPWGVALVLTLLMTPLVGLVDRPGLALFALAPVSALAAPATTLFIAGFADDKVQGFALTKVTGVAGLTVLGGWFVGEPGRWLLGLFPPFLPVMGLWRALAGRPDWPLPGMLGAVTGGLLVAVLARRLRRGDR